MKFISTRSNKNSIDFLNLLFSNLSDKGGLYVTASFPKIKKFPKQSYQQWAAEVIAKFSGPIYKKKDLIDIFNRAYASFYHPDIVVLKQFKNLEILELTHGPTRSFKDVALQALAQLIEINLANSNKKILILGATSGDTGSAALNAFKDKKNVKVIMLHPHNMVSDVQRLQMTTITTPKILNIAVKGSFDDCQNLVKSVFNSHKKFKNYDLTAVNSINFSRILLQIPYYFYCYSHSNNKDDFNLIVPSGNFGNILAAFYAKQMGLPINKLIVATNHNNVVERAINSGIYKPKIVKKSIAPAMDIQISSNFERLLFHYYDNSTAINKLYQDLAKDGFFKINSSIGKKINQDFMAYSASEKEAIAEIKKIKDKYDYLLDPHTAMASSAYTKSGLKNAVIVNTAHSAKSPELFKKLKIKPPIPNDIAELANKQSRQLIIDKDLDKLLEAINDFI